MDVHLSRAGTVPGREEHTAAAALVLDVLERVHHVGDAAQADEAAETKSPGVCGVARLVRNVGHGALSTGRAIRRRRSPVQRSNRRRILVDGAALSLRGHARVALGLVEARLLRLNEAALLLRGRRPSVLRLLRLRVHGLALLDVLLVRVLGIDRRLLGDVRRLGVLVHGYTLLLHCGGMSRTVENVLKEGCSVSRVRCYIKGAMLRLRTKDWRR